MDSGLIFRSYRVILNQWTKWNNRSFKWLPKTSFTGRLPIRQQILNVPQIGIAFHRICPPIFIQTWLQQYSRRTFFHSAHCSLSNPMCFWSVWCRRSMIPGKIFTSLRLQELLQAPFGCLRSFCFAQIRLDPLGGQVLHHDCISMTVSRFTPFTRTMWSAVIKSPKNFCTKYDSANTSSARCPCIFLVLWQISQFRSFGKWEKTLRAYQNPHFSLVLKKVHEKNSRVSLCVQELFHPQDSLWILATIPVCRNNTGVTVLARDSHFYLVLGFRLVHVRTLLVFQKWTGLLRTCLSTLSLDTIAGGWSEWSIFWPERVVGVEVDELEEVVDKPGTTIGKKFSVLHCVRKPFLMRCGFWPFTHSYEYLCSSQSFPSDRTADVSSRSFIVKENPILWHKL